MNPDAYRGRFGDDGAAYAADVEDVIRFGTSGQVAGFLSESIQGVGGAVPLAKGYLQEAYKVGFCIVFTGLFLINKLDRPKIIDGPEFRLSRCLQRLS